MEETVMKINTRRSFLQRSTSIGLAASTALRVRSGIAAPGERLGVGLMGCGGRGTQLIRWFAERPDVDIKYLCDVDQRMFGRVTAEVEDITGEIPKRITDFRRMLEDPDVDIIVVATPDHWHGLGTILACQAGKHVYVEKPASHNIWEGRKMVEAARKYNCVVQVGMQTRSMPYAQHAREFILSGKLRTVYAANVQEKRHSRGKFPQTKPIPDGLDYDMYCGPAQLVPYRPKPMYLTLWNFSGGWIQADAIHQLDLVRWLIGQKHPGAVHHSGGIYVTKDGRECQDTMTATYEYDDLQLTFQGIQRCPYMTHNIRYDWMATAEAATKQFGKKITAQEGILFGDTYPDWLRDSTRVEIYGTEGMMVIGRHGGGWQVWGPDGGILAQEHGQHYTKLHIDNFIDCIRTGKRPTCDIEDGHYSAALNHLANISFRVGNRYLKFDGMREAFPGDSEANTLLKRNYREPWVIPEKV
jgi:predicted dehydrogenase